MVAMFYSAYKETVAGASAGVVGTILGFPFDSLKTRMQTSLLSIPQAFQEIYYESGFLGFYQGVGSPLLALTVLNTLNFSSYSYFCSLLGIDHIHSKTITHDGKFDMRISLAAAGVGPIASIISTPFELIKTQMQLIKKFGTNEKQFSNSFQLITHILRTKGVSSMYVGHRVNTIREIIFLSTYFSVYEYLKYHCSNISTITIPKAFSIALAGGISGSIGWFISFPFDCIKSNIQGRDLSLNSFRKFSDTSIAIDILKSRGLKGLYSGVLPSILRAFIVSSSRFSAYEATLYLLDA